MSKIIFPIAAIIPKRILLHVVKRHIMSNAAAEKLDTLLRIGSHECKWSYHTCSVESKFKTAKYSSHKNKVCWKRGFCCMLQRVLLSHIGILL